MNIVQKLLGYVVNSSPANPTSVPQPIQEIKMAISQRTLCEYAGRLVSDCPYCAKRIREFEDMQRAEKK